MQKCIGQRKTEDTKLRLWLAYSSFAVNPAGISDNLPDSLLYEIGYSPPIFETL